MNAEQRRAVEDLTAVWDHTRGKVEALRDSLDSICNMYPSPELLDTIEGIAQGLRSLADDISREGGLIEDETSDDEEEGD